jgi:hypothetical protein
MSLAQWMFEYRAQLKKERDTVDITANLLKTVLVNVLGLNALRPTDDKGKPKSFDEMTEEDRKAFLPLVAWVSRPDMLKAVKEQLDVDVSIMKATQDAEYEKMVQAIDSADGDMEPFFSSPIVKGPDLKELRYKEQLMAMVKPYPKDDSKKESVINVDVDVDGEV